jgi:hypothetical protein
MKGCGGIPPSQDNVDGRAAIRKTDLPGTPPPVDEIPAR